MVIIRTDIRFTLTRVLHDIATIQKRKENGAVLHSERAIHLVCIIQSLKLDIDSKGFEIPPHAFGLDLGLVLTRCDLSIGSFNVKITPLHSIGLAVVHFDPSPNAKRNQG